MTQADLGSDARDLGVNIALTLHAAFFLAIVFNLLLVDSQAYSFCGRALFLAIVIASRRAFERRMRYYR